MKPSWPILKKSNPLANGLVLAYPMAEGSANAAIHDASGYDRHGSITGTLSSEGGKFGWAYQYPNALTDFILAGTDTILDFSNPWTVSIWMHADSFGSGGFATVWQFKTSSSVGFILFINDNNVGYKSISFGSASVFPNLQTVTAITSTIQNVWSNIVLTYNGGTVSSASSYELFVNAVSRPTQVAGAFGVVSQTNWIGRGDAASTPFDGKIDNIHVWERQLSHEEVALIYHDPYIMYRNHPIHSWIGGAIIAAGDVFPAWEKRRRMNKSLLTR